MMNAEDAATSSSSATPSPIMPMRSLDEFLEFAYTSRPRFNTFKLRFYVVFFALGLANSGDSAEMGSTNYSAF